MASASQEPSTPEEIVRSTLLESSRVEQEFAQTQTSRIVAAAELIAAVLAQGGKLLAFGNGGSAADAQHFVGELVGRFRMQGRAPYPAIALTADTSVLTCLANDFGYEEIFGRQVEALGAASDLVLAISTSGRSPNVLRGIAAAHAIGCRTIALTGHPGEPLAGMVDAPIVVPSLDTQRVQEAHITALHILADLVERAVGDAAHKGLLPGRAASTN